MQKFKFHAIKCPLCKDIVYSVANHDFRPCSCQNIFIDGNSSIHEGGTVVFRQGWVAAKGEETIVEVEAENYKELYDDYNIIKKERKYGLIKESK